MAQGSGYWLVNGATGPLIPINSFYPAALYVSGVFGAAGNAVVEGTNNNGGSFTNINATVTANTPRNAPMQVTPGQYQAVRMRVTAGDGTTLLHAARTILALSKIDPNDFSADQMLDKHAEASYAVHNLAMKHLSGHASGHNNAHALLAHATAMNEHIASRLGHPEFSSHGTHKAMMEHAQGLYDTAHAHLRMSLPSIPTNVEG